MQNRPPRYYAFLMFALFLSCITLTSREQAFAQGVWTTKAPMPTARQGLGVAVVNNKLYALGGATGVGTFDVVDTVEAYDPATDTWSTKAPMPTARYGVRAGVINGLLYAVGGSRFGSCGGFVATLEVYDPQTNTWTTKTSMPTARCATGVGVVNGILYVAGGDPGNSNVFSTVEAYNPATDTWTTKAPMPTARSWFAMSVLNGLIYAVGSGLSLNPVEVYDPSTDLWTTGLTPMPTGRTTLTSGVVNGLFYAIGGPGVGSTVEAYNPATDSWTTQPSLSVARSILGGGAIGGTLYAVGGWNGSNSVTTIEAFTPITTCVAPPSGMVSWWPGDGNANDIVGTNNGTLVNGTSFAAGKVGQAFSFDGLDDGFEVTLSPSNPLIITDEPITIDLWYKPPSVIPSGAIYTLVEAGQAIPVGGTGHYVVDTGNTGGLSGGKVRFLDRNTSGSVLRQVITSTGLPLGQWTHLAATVDGTGQGVIYFNGVAQPLSVETENVGDRTSMLEKLTIGYTSDTSQATGGVRFTEGLIDEVEIFNRALSATEIQAIFNAGSAGKCKTPPNQPPMADAGEDQVQEASGPSGTPVTLDASGSSDPDNNNLTFTWTGPFSEGGGTVTGEVVQVTLQIGTHTIDLLVDDGQGETSTDFLLVQIGDTTDPVLSGVPGNITVEATIPAGAAVTYTPPTASDTVDPSPTLDCTPASGSIFPLGATVVTCTATDASGNTADASFNVTVVNTPPAVTSLTLSEASIKEHDIVTLNGTFTDPTTIDSHTVTINWGDGSATTVVNPATGLRAFSAPHQYLDDVPTNTPVDINMIQVTVTDSQGQNGGGSTSITVNNVAPVIPVDGIAGPVEPIALGGNALVTATFSDVGTLDTHTCTFSWDDGTADDVVALVGTGNTSCAAPHTYAGTGVYQVTVTVDDDDTGTVGSTFDFVVVYEPSGGFVTGGGWIDLPAGAYVADPSLTGKATFGFVSKYKKGATTPTGQTEFQFQAASLNFHSSSYDWLVIAGHKAMYKGTGTINGIGNYGFLLSAIDAKLTLSTEIDLFRIKIYDKDNGDEVVYDNQLGGEEDSDASMAINKGAIVIHKGK